jgi:hypothetical protein
MPPSTYCVLFSHPVRLLPNHRSPRSTHHRQTNPSLPSRHHAQKAARRLPYAALPRLSIRIDRHCVRSHPIHTYLRGLRQYASRERRGILIAFSRCKPSEVRNAFARDTAPSVLDDGRMDIYPCITLVAVDSMHSTCGISYCSQDGDLDQ